MADISFATLRLGKTSITSIKELASKAGGILSPAIEVSVVCTQVPAELECGSYVFIWLGSDNSKGIATEWKQGFKAVGKVIDLNRGEKYNDESTTVVAVSYIFSESINRLDILREAPMAYYWCSALPIIGLDDHSNQTIRMISTNSERSVLEAFFNTLKSVRPEFESGITSVYAELAPYFKYDVPNPREENGDGVNISRLDEYQRAANIMKDYVLESGFQFPYDQERVQAIRDEFMEHYSPEELKNLTEDNLLQTIFYNAQSNNDSLCYFLEMENECRLFYGSIAGGSAYKFGLFQKKEDGIWYSGSPAKPQILSADEALELGRKVRDGLVDAAKYIESTSFNYLSDYERLDDEIKLIFGEKFWNLAWIHKYLSILFPELLSGWHNTDWQKHVLYSLRIKPSEKYYARSGQIAMVCKYTDWQYPQFAPACYDKFGDIKRFVRLGTSDNDANYADEWKSKGCVGIGWGRIGSLEEFVSANGIERKAVTEKIREVYYPDDARKSSRKAGEMVTFYRTDKNTIFVMMNGNTPLALVDNIGKYFYEDGLNMPNLKHGTWHCCFNIGEYLPKKQAGHMTSCYELSDDENLMYLYEKYYYNLPDQDREEDRKMQEMKIDSIEYVEPEYNTEFETDYERNRIVFGAPGTGKSYKLKQESDELIRHAKRHMERVTFHSDYSYSQFVGSYKPVTDEKGDIRYDFVPGPFMRVYVKAVRNSQQILKTYDLIKQAQVMHMFPTNPNPANENDKWNLFEEIFEVGQQETFKCAKDAKIGDMALIYVAKTDEMKENGIYAIGTIVGKPSDDIADIRFDYVSYYYPIISYETLKQYNPNIRSYGRVSEAILDLVKKAVIPANPYLLLIEEINRAKVAAVFGDVFQLLDRDDEGVSVYEIQTSEDVRRHLASRLGGKPEQWMNIKLPNNMFIWATMNSADQGVYPMDTAFKRRWGFEYLGINDGEDEMNSGIVLLGKGDHELEVDWNQFRKAINEKLASNLKVNEDKLMGPFFLSTKITEPDEDGYITNPDGFIKAFKSKIIMYLYEDAAKQHKHKLFSGCDSTKYSTVCTAFDEIGIDIFGDDFRELYNQQEG